MRKTGKWQSRHALIGFVFLCCAVAILYALLPTLTSAEETRTVVDQSGRSVAVPEHPRRVLALSTALDIVVLAYLPPNEIAAVSKDTCSEYSSLVWKQARQVPQRISRNVGPEEIMALRPDLVLAPDYLAADTVESLRAMGLSVVTVITPYRVDAVDTMIDQVGAALGREERAQELHTLYANGVAQVQARAATIPPDERRKVLMMSGMVGYGGTGSLFADANRAAGLINAAEAAGIPDHTPFTEERLLQMDPDVLFVPTYSRDNHRQAAAIMADPALATLAAVRNRRVIPVRPAYVYNSSVTLAEALAAIQTLSYPERFADLVPRYTDVVALPAWADRRDSEAD